MIHQEATALWQNVMKSFPMLQTSEAKAELPTHVLLDMKKQLDTTTELTVGHLIWQPKKNEAQLYLAIDPSFLLAFFSCAGQLSETRHESEASRITISATLNPMAAQVAVETAKQRNKPSTLYFDEAKSQFFIGDQAIPHSHLTELEHDLLKYLYQNAERPCSYRNIAKHVWRGWAKDNTITQQIYRLRKKLKQISPTTHNVKIETCRGYSRGYILTQK